MCDNFCICTPCSTQTVFILIFHAKTLKFHKAAKLLSSKAFHVYGMAIYVTGYWKTDHNVTLGHLLFIGPANSHTHTLSVRCCINGLI